MDINNIKLEDIVARAPEWNFAGDNLLLQWMKQISEGLELKANQTTTGLTQLDTTIKRTTIGLNNLANSITALQYGNQFVESRVKDDDDILDKADTVSTSAEQFQAAPSQDETFNKFLENNIKVLRNCHEKYSVDIKGSDEEDEAHKTYIYQPKNPYNDRPLPHIIGSKEWNDNWHVGLYDGQSNKYSEDEKSEVYSESTTPSDDAKSYESSHTANFSQWASSTSLQHDTFQTKCEVKNASSLRDSQQTLNRNSNKAPKPVARKPHSETSSTTSTNSLAKPNNATKNTALDVPKYACMDTGSLSGKSECKRESNGTKLQKDPKIDNDPDRNVTNSIQCKTTPAPLFVDLFAEPPEDVPPPSFTTTQPRITRKPINLFDDDNFQSLMSEIVQKTQIKNTSKEEVTPTVQETPSYVSPLSQAKFTLVAKSLFEDDNEDEDDFLNTFTTKNRDLPIESRKKTLLLDDKIEGNLNLLKKHSIKTNLFDEDDFDVENIPEKETRDDESKLRLLVDANMNSTKSKNFKIKPVTDNYNKEGGKEEEAKSALFNKSKEVSSINKTVLQANTNLATTHKSETIEENKDLCTKSITSPTKILYKKNISEQIPIDQRKLEANEIYPPNNGDKSLMKSTTQEKRDVEVNESIKSDISNVNQTANLNQDAPKILSNTNDYKLNASLFLDEPPDDDEFFENLPPSQHSSFPKSENDFYEPDLSKLPQPQTQNSDVHRKSLKNPNIYKNLQLFNDVPPDDDGDDGRTGSNDNIDNIPTPHTTKLHNIFYDDFNETLQALNESQEHTRNPDGGCGDRALPKEYSNEFKPLFLPPKVKTIPRLNNSKNETNHQTESSSRQKDLAENKYSDDSRIADSAPKVNKIQMPNTNINVRALLPGSEVQQPLNKPPPEHCESDEKEEALKNKDRNVEYILPNMNKNRVKIPIRRRPSTRKGRQENYEKSLLQDQQFNESGTDKINIDSRPISSESQTTTDTSTTNNVSEELYPNLTNDFNKAEVKENSNLNKVFEDDNDDWDDLFAAKSMEKKSNIMKIHSTTAPVPYKTENKSKNILYESKDQNKSSTISRSLAINNNNKDKDAAKVKAVEEKLTKVSSRLFDDSDDDDDDLFGNASTSTTNAKNKSLAQTQTSLFSDGDDDDLFMRTNLVTATGKQLTKTIPSSKNLFDEDTDSDENDLFGGTSSKAKQLTTSLDATHNTDSQLKTDSVGKGKGTADNPLADLL